MVNKAKILYAAIIFAIWSMVVNEIAAFLAMGYYTNPAYYGLWSSLMMSTNGPPSMTFYIASLAFALLSGLIFATAYSAFGGSIPGKGARKGFNFGLVLFSLVSIPGFSMTFLTLAVPMGLLFSWVLASLVTYVLSGIAFERILRDRIPVSVRARIRRRK